MTEKENTIEILYSPAEVSDTIKVKESTLRKYVNILESAGYVFSKNNRGHRQYKDNDVIALKRFIAASERPDMTLETAAEQIVAMYDMSSMTLTDTTDITLHEQHNKDISELKEIVENQSKVIQELIKRLEERDRHIEKRDKQLMDGIRELQDQKKELLQIAAANEEQKNKGFWSRVFGK
jgi:DNA-binding transcriptional MerR regulator